MEDLPIVLYLTKLGLAFCPPSQWEIFETYFRERIYPQYTFSADDLYEVQCYLDLAEDHAGLQALIQADTKEIVGNLSASQIYLIVLRLVLLRRYVFGVGSAEVVKIGELLGVGSNLLNMVEKNLEELDWDSLPEDRRNILLFFELPDEFDAPLLTQARRFEAEMVLGKKRLRSLSVRRYEHPLDLKTLQALKSLDFVTKILAEPQTEIELRKTILSKTGSSILVTEHNLKELYFLFRECCEILDISPVPLLYITAGGLNAETLGTKENAVVIVHSGAIGLLTKEEMMALLGHELGHIKSGHYYYTLVGQMMAQALQLGGDMLLQQIPVLGPLLKGGVDIAIMNKFYQWQKSSEFTADRAGLLCCQDLEAALSLEVKLAGWPIKYYGQIDTASFLHQADLFLQINQDLVGKTIEFFTSLYSEHPWTVLRAAFLKQWTDQGGYQSLLGTTAAFLPEP